MDLSSAPGVTTGTCPATSSYAPGCMSGCTSATGAGASAGGYGRRLLDGSGYGSASGSASGSGSSGYSDSSTDCSTASNQDVCQAAQEALAGQKQAAPQLICQVRLRVWRKGFGPEGPECGAGRARWLRGHD